MLFDTLSCQNPENAKNEHLNHLLLLLLRAFTVIEFTDKFQAVIGMLITSVYSDIIHKEQCQFFKRRLGGRPR